MITIIASMLARRWLTDDAGEIRVGWRWLFSSATHALEAALFLAIAFGLWERHELIRARADLASIKAAQTKARADQIAINHQPAVISAAIAEQANADDRKTRAAIVAAGDVYARSHGVGGASCGLRPQAGGAPGPADLSRADQPASGGSGSDVSSGMVAITRADFDGLSRNTADLDALRAAIDKLRQHGLVVIDKKEGGE